MIILVTGTRNGWDRVELEEALWSAFQEGPEVTPWNVMVVHGDAKGVDAQSDEIAREYGMFAQAYPAGKYGGPRKRNQYMVDLVADLVATNPNEVAVCLSFAESWASGTGMCARMARRAGIRVIDYGVDTGPESRPIPDLFRTSKKEKP